MRIHEFAKEHNIENKKIIEILKNNNIQGKTHSSSISDAEKKIVLDTVKGNKQQAQKPKQVQEHKPANQVKPAQTPAPQRTDSSRGAERHTEGKHQNNNGQKSQGNGGNNRNERNDHNRQGGKRNDRNDRSDRTNDRQNRGNGNSANGDRKRSDSGNGNRQNGSFNGNRQNNGNGGNRQSGNGYNTDRNRQGGGFGNDKGRNNGNRANSGSSNRPSQNRSMGAATAMTAPTGVERGERGSRNNRMERNDYMDHNDRNRNGGKNNRQNDRNKNNRNGFASNGSYGNKNKNNRNNKNNRGQQQPAQKVEIVRPKSIKVGESIVVKDLASKLCCTAAEIIKKLFLSFGQMANINESIDFDTATLVANEYGVEVEELPPEVDPTEIPEVEDDPKSLVIRPPVVTVMGHVDHGKTSLLDNIRKTHVTSQEAGGITQHIGAYQVMCQGKKIVFLDTPGHEAFTAMRARGAQITDIAILVVAADDGVMPQTIEAIHHAKSANVPIIVAINKIDKPGADPTRVKNELMEYNLVAEEYGGDTIMVEVSAKKQINIDGLLEMVLLVAEVQELKSNPKREARGVIIEAQLDKGRGSVATVLVQKGTLHIGDSIVAGTCYGKIRAMINDRGENVKKAGPSVPVEVLGLNGVPSAGDELAALDEKLCKSIAEKRIEKQHMELIRSKKVSLDDLFQQIQEGQLKDLNILVKADVQGSVEAINSSLLGLNKNDEVRVNIIHSGVGAVNESDVMLATAANALIIAFNVRPDANARRIAESEDIDIRTYRVIYDAINDVKDAMSGMLAPKFKEVIQGRVEIRQVMIFNKTLMVAGSYVLEGKITNKSKIRIVRDNIEVFDGELDDLRRFKDAVKEVAAGYECGITIKDYRDFREGDIIEAYTMEEIKTDINDINKK